jgi:hypothetical protein
LENLMLTHVLDGAFRVCLALFLLGGAILVLLQLAGLITGAGPLVVGAVDWVGLPTFALAGVAGLLGFALSYLKGWDTAD